jgi:hypothetical protein
MLSVELSIHAGSIHLFQNEIHVKAIYVAKTYLGNLCFSISWQKLSDTIEVNLVHLLRSYQAGQGIHPIFECLSNTTVS